MKDVINSESSIDRATLQAYEETEYRVKGEAPFVLRVGRASRELAGVHQASPVRSSAFITACNPFGATLADEQNALRQLDLAKELTSRSLSFIAGVGQHPSNEWPGEESYLILGLTLDAAKTMGRRLEQNAIVWAGDDAVPQLVLLK